MKYIVNHMWNYVIGAHATLLIWALFTIPIASTIIRPYITR